VSYFAAEDMATMESQPPFQVPRPVSERS